MFLLELILGTFLIDNPNLSIGQKFSMLAGPPSLILLFGKERLHSQLKSSFRYVQVAVLKHSIKQVGRDLKVKEVFIPTIVLN